MEEMEIRMRMGLETSPDKDTHVQQDHYGRDIVEI